MFLYKKTVQALVDRASTPDNITWALEGLVDHYRMTYIDLGAFSISKLRDHRHSYISILCLKKAVHVELLEEWLPSSGLAGNVKTVLAKVFDCFSVVRKKVTCYPDETEELDNSWRLGWPDSAAFAADLIEELVFGVNFDGRYRDALKTSLTVAADILDYPSIKAKFDQIEAAIQVERGPPAETAASAGTSAASAGASSTPAASAGSATPAHTQNDPSVSFPEVALKLPEAERQEWLKHVNKTISAHVKFVADQKTISSLEAKLKEAPLAMLRGDPTGLVLYHYDVKKAAETHFRPELRIAPLQDKEYKRVVKAVLSARKVNNTDPAMVNGGEVALLLDGGRRGNMTRLLAPWKEEIPRKRKRSDKDDKGGKGDDDEDVMVDDVEEDEADGSDADSKASLQVKILQVAYTEASIARRRALARGTASLHQVEWAHILAGKAINLPERPRKHYEGTNCGDLLIGVEMPPLASEWHVSVKEKAVYLGKKKLIDPASAGSAVAAPAGSAAEAREDAVQVPFCYHSMPENFYAELIHMFFAKLVLDLTPSDARFAWVALRSRIGYCGLANNEEHAEAMRRQLRHLTFKGMLDQNSGLYNAAYAAAVEQHSPVVAKAAEGKVAKGKAKAKSKATEAKAAEAKGEAKSKAKAKSKAAAKAAEDDDHQDEAPISGDEDDVWDPLADLDEE